MEGAEKNITQQNAYSIPTEDKAVWFLTVAIFYLDETTIKVTCQTKSVVRY